MEVWHFEANQVSVRPYSMLFLARIDFSTTARDEKYQSIPVHPRQW